MNTKTIFKIHWSESIWFFDIDDTLIDTAGNTLNASEGIKRVFSAKYTKDQSQLVQNNFNNIFELMLSGYRVKDEDDWRKVKGGKEVFNNLLNDIENSQIRIKEKYGVIKKWSREVFVKLAAEKAGLKVTPALVHEAVDAYWLILTEQTIAYPHALNLIQKIKARSRPIYLITSSDGRLKMDNEGQFDYDPQYSAALKRQRIELLREKGVIFNAVSIGDPEDKPHQDFFEKGLKIAENDLGSILDTSHVIIVGDSFGGDLQTPKEKMGFGLVVLFEKDRSNTEVVDEHQITTGILSEVANFLV
ncbi:MAG: hypothetical protein PHV63_01060 [Candidatus Daviesbacteria bacterium]|nr:hypothetical protein [Candidatus Daviesbacteria bacterium]